MGLIIIQLQSIQRHHFLRLEKGKKMYLKRQF